MKALYTFLFSVLTVGNLFAQATEKVTILETHGLASNNLQQYDFNNDGVKDFITHYGSMFRIHYSDGSETWTATTEINPGITLTFENYVVADMNGDNFNDIIFTTVGYSSTIKWLENPTDGSETWTEHVITGLYKILLGVFDVDGDMQSDIVYENSLGYLGWIKNDAGEFTLFNAIPDVYEYSILNQVEDFDKDGDDDMVIYSYTCCVNYFENNSDGTFTVTEISTAYDLHAIHILDYNGDGYKDVITQLNTELNVANFNPVSGDFSAETFFGFIEAQNISIADIDGDSDEDFLCMISNDVTGYTDLFWRENTGALTLSPLSLLVDSVSDFSSYFYFYDYNGDTKADLFGSNNGRLYVQLSDMPLNTFLPSFNPDYIYLRMDLIRYFDVNNDGQTDIMLANRDGVIGWIAYDQINDSISSVHHLPKIEGSPYPVDMIEADLDNDLDLDLIISLKSFYGGVQTSYYCINDGVGNFTMHEFSSDAFGQMHVLDSDEDGFVDLIGWDIVLKSIKIYDNSGDTSNLFPTYLTVAPGTVNGFDLADIDNDGDLDIIYSKTADLQIQIAYNEPGIHFEGGADFFSHDCVTASLIYADDFDNNGFMDVGYSCISGAIKISSNTDGVFTTAEFGTGKIGVTYGPSYTDDIDVNQDGINDLIASDFVNGTSIKLSTGPSTFMSENSIFSKDYGRFLFVDTNDIIDFIGTNDNEIYILYDLNFTAPDITITDPTFAWIEEGGAGSSVSVFANTIPNHTLQILFTPDVNINAGAGVGEPVTITLLPDASSLIPQTITYTVPDDALIENIQYKNCSITTPLGTWGVFAGIMDDIDTFLISDNDLGLFVSHTSVTLMEGALPLVITCNINKIATEPVTVTLTPGSDINLNGTIGAVATIEIPAGIASVESFAYSVANPNDDIDEDAIYQEVAYLLNSTDITIDGFIGIPLNVSLMDNDVANVLRYVDYTNIVEGIDVLEFQIELTTAPAQDVFIEITPDIQLDLGFGAGVATTIVFPAGDVIPDLYSVFGSAVDDGIVEDMHIGKLTFDIYSDDPFYDDETLSILNIYILDQDSTGVAIQQTDTAPINIFPSVSSGSFQVEINTEIDHLLVYNSLGEAVYFSEINSVGTHNLDLRLLAVGTYYVTITNQDLKHVIPVQIVK